MRVTDAQVHIWKPESAARPWPAGGTAHAHALSFSPEQLLAAMDDAHVDRAVLVPPSWEGDRNDYCSEASAAYPDRFVYMARLDLASPAVTKDYEALRETSGFSGLRLTFRKKESREILSSGAVDWLWEAAARDRVPVCVYAPGLLPQFWHIASRHDELKLAIDHLALPLDSDENDLVAVTKMLSEFIALENVAVKATCLPSHVRDDYPYVSVRASLEQLIDGFGASRVFWGSDLSRLRGTYDEVRRLFTEELPFLTGSALEYVMGRGIEEWLGWTDDTR
jgi:L-fuconolactonase